MRQLLHVSKQCPIQRLWFDASVDDLTVFSSEAFLTGNDPAAAKSFLGRKMSYLGHNDGPPCATISVPTPKTARSVGRLKDDNSLCDMKLVWTPMYVTGTFKDYDMSRKQFVYIVMPSGISDHRVQVEYGLSNDLTSVYLNVLMPGLLVDAHKLHSDTFVGDFNLLSTDEINRNVRVMTYNDILSGLLGTGANKGGLKWASTIPLEEPAANNSFVRKKWKKCSATKCLVLCLDVLIEDSNYMKEDEEDSIESL